MPYTEPVMLLDRYAGEVRLNREQVERHAFEPETRGVWNFTHAHGHGHDNRLSHADTQKHNRSAI